LKYQKEKLNVSLKNWLINPTVPSCPASIKAGQDRTPKARPVRSYSYRIPPAISLPRHCEERSNLYVGHSMKRIAVMNAEYPQIRHSS
jgi:hypothetical protein